MADPCSRCRGTGKEPWQPTLPAVIAYMRATGWTPRPPGPAGSLWWHPGTSAEIGVLHSLGEEEDLRGVIRRLAVFEKRTMVEVAAAIWEREGKSNG